MGIDLRLQLLGDAVLTPIAAVLRAVATAFHRDGDAALTTYVSLVMSAAGMDASSRVPNAALMEDIAKPATFVSSIIRVMRLVVAPTSAALRSSFQAARASCQLNTRALLQQQLQRPQNPTT